jgi:hypothetical protein
VVESAALTKPRRLFQHLGENKRFEQWSEHSPVFRDPLHTSS